MPSPTRVLACCQEPLKLGSFSGFGSISGVNSCDRTASHLLGMQRAIGLMQQEEAVSGEYNMTIVMRWDVVWHQPFALRGLDISRGGVVLPTYCTSSDPRSGIVTQPNVSGIMAYRQAVCGGGASFLVVPTAARECNHGKHRPCMGDLTPLAREVRRTFAVQRRGPTTLSTPCAAVIADHVDALPWELPTMLAHPPSPQIYLLDWWFISSSDV